MPPLPCCRTWRRPKRATVRWAAEPAVLAGRALRWLRMVVMVSGYRSQGGPPVLPPFSLLHQTGWNSSIDSWVPWIMNSLERGCRQAGPMELLIRTHLIEAPSELAAQTERLRAARLSLPPAVASIFRAQLVDRLGEI